MGSEKFLKAYTPTNLGAERTAGVGPHVLLLVLAPVIPEGVETELRLLLVVASRELLEPIHVIATAEARRVRKQGKY